MLMDCFDYLLDAQLLNRMAHDSRGYLMTIALSKMSIF